MTEDGRYTNFEDPGSSVAHYLADFCIHIQREVIEVTQFRWDNLYSKGGWSMVVLSLISIFH